jgi:lysophospholipase L1-like esterase
MRIKLILTAAVAALMCLAPASALAHGGSTTKPEYYVALGDSLSRGDQPTATGKTINTNDGYTNDIYAVESKKIKDLAYKDLGCPGETTTTMIKGGICKYAAGSQLKAAKQFLDAHKGHIAFVTIDIGANDVDNCITSMGINTTCIAEGEASIEKNVPKIAATLRKATGAKVPIAGMNYYDPFLAAWFDGSSGQAEAGESQLLAKSVNKDIASGYTSNGVKEVADVADAFHTYESLSDTENYQGNPVPVAVVKICKLTWMCAPSPIGPNIHADAAGYRVIAGVFEEKKL